MRATIKALLTLRVRVRVHVRVCLQYGVKSGRHESMDALIANQYQNEWISEQGKKEDKYSMAKKMIPVTVRSVPAHVLIYPHVVHDQEHGHAWSISLRWCLRAYE